MLLEGVPGLAKTLTVKTLAQVLGGSFRRIQFTPDLVPADLVGTRVYRPDTGRFDIELGPVFGNFLLADEINRAPAKVQSALLEVMQEQQVTIGGQTFPVPRPFLVHGHAEPDRVRGHLPAARGAGRPLPDEDRRRLPDVRRGGRGRRPRLGAMAEVRERLSLDDLDRFARATDAILVDRDVIGYAVALADATRNPAAYGLDEIAGYIEYGASPRGPIGLVHAARALALLRGRGHVGRLRHPRPRGRRPAPPHRALLRRAERRRHRRRPARPRARRRDGAVVGRRRTEARPREPTRAVAPAVPAARQGPGPIPRAASRRSTSSSRGVPPGRCRGDRRAAGIGAGTELAQLRPYEVGDDVRQIDAAATARTGEPHVRLHVPERTLTTWIVLDVSPSMAFGTARRLKADVAEGVALVVGRLAVRRAGRVGAPDLRRAATPRCCRRAPRSPASWRSSATLDEGVAADGRQRPGRAGRARSCASARSRTQPGLVVVISDFRDQDGAGRARSARCAPRHSVLARRDPRPARGDAAGRRAASPLIDPETGERDRGRHLPPRVRERFAADRGRGPRPASPASCAGCASSTWCCRPRATGCASSGGGCGELRLPASRCSGLLALPLLVAAADGAPRRRARRYAVRFTGRAGAPGRRGRRRRPGAATCPAALALRALAALVLRAGQAAAHRRGAGRARLDHARHRPLALDAGHRRGARPARRRAGAPRATFLAQVPRRVRVGVVAYSNAPDAVQAPTTDHDEARRVIDAQVADGATATGDALQVALDTLKADKQNGKRPPAAIVLLSDGKTTTGRDPVEVARTAGKLHIPIYTVALGTRRRHRPEPRLRPAAAGAARPGDAGADRPGVRRQGVHGRGLEPARVDLQGARLAARHEERAARGHVVVRADRPGLLLGGAALSVRSRGRLP